MIRRKFLKTVGAAVSAEALLSTIPLNAMADSFFLNPQASGINILQGVTTDTTTQITVDLSNQLKIEYSLADRETGKIFQPEWIRTNSNVKSNVRVDRLFFSGLELGHKYQLNVKNTATNINLDERFLTTVDLNKANPKIAVMSCMKDSVSSRTKMWLSAQAADADYYFFIGDNVYGDSVFSHGPDLLWSRFVETRTNIGYYQWKTMKPVIAVWDDHDFGKNNEGGRYEHKDKTLKVFKAFFGQESQGAAFQEGPGNSSYFRAFHQNFFFLDSRYFRGLPSLGTTGFLGEAQLNWVSQIMAGVSGPVWVMSGSPHFGRADKSNTSYQATAPQEHKLFLDQVSKWNAPAIFLGGDLHYSEASGIDKNILGYQTYEFISSCMHSSSKSGYYQNPNRQLHGTLKENFLVFEKNGEVFDPNWKVSSVGADSKVFFAGQYNVG